MALPSRKSLVDRINQLEADIAPLAAAAGLGYVGGKLVPVSTLARGASAISPIGAAALLADLAIREEQSLAYRGALPVARGLGAVAERIQEETPSFGAARAVPGKKRKKSSFNAAVSAGMKAIKASSFQGAKGVLSNPKKTFAMVTKVASNKLKGLKAPKSGARRRAFGSMPKSLRKLRGK
jgi:hypothetical protein